MRVEHTTRIQRTARELFPYFVEGPKLQQWVSGLVDSQYDDGDPPAVGSRFRHVFEEGGQRQELRGTITELREDESLRLTLEGDRFRADVEYRLRPEGRSTEIQQTSDIQVQHWLARMLTPLLRNRTRRQLGENYEKLRKLLEKAAPSL